MLIKHGYTAAGFCGLREYKGKKVYPKAVHPPEIAAHLAEHLNEKLLTARERDMLLQAARREP